MIVTIKPGKNSATIVKVNPVLTGNAGSGQVTFTGTVTVGQPVPVK
jgi:hypothetical protein